MFEWSQCPAIERTADKVSGAWVFKGTRVPVKALFENLEDGARVEDFLSWFPGVARDQVEAVLPAFADGGYRLHLREFRTRPREGWFRPREFRMRAHEFS
ncbi:MAG: DUF433 domain-containing protein [Thermoanaerobaculia bacterium]